MKPARGSGIAVDGVEVSVFTIPTDRPESDGTFAWDRTTIVVVEITAGNRRGLGYSYADRATASFVNDHLRPVVLGRDPMDIRGAWEEMVRAMRNLGRQGVGAMALSAMDTALWDLKSMLLEIPLVSLMGAARSDIPVYASGGFTSYTNDELVEQLGGWAMQGFSRVKMKVGRDPAHDVDRVSLAREAVGPETELFVDANGAYSESNALSLAAEFVDFGVHWFEEPVSSDDLDGLHRIRSRKPEPLDIAAGEYAYDPYYVRRMLAAQAVDVIQFDATRIGGFTGFLECAAIADAFQTDVSAHCAPALHTHIACAAPRMRHIEYFHDHVRIERMLFDGVVAPEHGVVTPDRSRPGLGLVLRRADARRFAA